VVRIGYGLMLAAGTLLAGYVAVTLVRLLLSAPGIPVLFKAIILLGALGLVVTIVGLVVERRKEERHAAGDNGDDPR